MSDSTFPATIKPLTNRNYSYSRGSNIVQVKQNGGLPVTALDNTIESPVFKLNFLLTESDFLLLMNFYDTDINHGANSFSMQLNGGQGIEAHQCTIVPGSFTYNQPSKGNWYVAFDVWAEKTFSQLDVCDNLYQVWDCYGEQTCALLQALEDYVLETPHE